MSQSFCIHLIPNAHLDPVWLWDWREGLTEAVTTSRTVLNMMDAYPDLTFIRGESFLYQHIEANDPATFLRIRAMVEQGRWDVVGGTMLQSDMNLPATQTMLRHLLYAQRYFKSRFGLQARAGWSADCFGHAAPLPDLLTEAGLQFYAYTRPGHVPPYETFWWEGPAGARLLVHHPTVGWYGMERDELLPRLDRLLAKAQAEETFQNIACFMGLGNHGGQPTQRMIREAAQWAEQHPAVRLIYSTLTGFFDSLLSEINRPTSPGVPVFKGELNFAPRGVYAANARFKFAYRKAEAAVQRAERVNHAIAAAAGASAFDLKPAWEALLFNSFHDILPGSSIERCYDEQLDWLNSAPHQARLAEQRAIYALAARVDTRVRPPAEDMPAGIPILAFNPHPWPYEGLVEVEAGLDYRPIWKYRDHPQDLPVVMRDSAGQPLALQVIPAENMYLPAFNIRTRAVIPLRLPAFGWQVLEYAYEEGASILPVANAVIGTSDSIANSRWEVRAVLGETGIHLRHDDQPVFDLPGFSLLTVEDPYGTWGDFGESPESRSLTHVRQSWTITRVERGENGPLRATLHVRLEAGRSRIDLCFMLCQGRDAVDVQARLFWDERCAHVKIALPGKYQQATYEVLGGQVQRGAAGEVPGGRWVSFHGGLTPLGFASNALYGYNLTPEGCMQVSIARATRYAAEGSATLEALPWYPVMDVGELRFNFLLTTQIDDLPHLAEELEQPVLLAPVTPSAGDWERSASLLALAPGSLRLLALKSAEAGEGWVLHIQSTSNEAVAPIFTWLGQTFSLPTLAPYALAAFRLERDLQTGWSVRLCDLMELNFDK